MNLLIKTYYVVVTVKKQKIISSDNRKISVSTILLYSLWNFTYILCYFLFNEIKLFLNIYNFQYLYVRNVCV